MKSQRQVWKARKGNCPLCLLATVPGGDGLTEGSCECSSKTETGRRNCPTFWCPEHVVHGRTITTQPHVLFDNMPGSHGL